MDDGEKVREAEQLVLEVDPDEYGDPHVRELHDRAVEILEDLWVQMDAGKEE